MRNSEDCIWSYDLTRDMSTSECCTECTDLFISVTRPVRKLLPCHLITWSLREEQIWDLTSSQLCCQWQLCSGLCCCFIGWAVPFTSSDVGRCDPVKRWWLLTQQHAITFQKTWILRSRFVEHGSEVNWVCLLTSRLYSSMDLIVCYCVLRMP